VQREQFLASESDYACGYSRSNNNAYHYYNGGRRGKLLPAKNVLRIGAAGGWVLIPGNQL
jgi:hypothetical protein